MKFLAQSMKALWAVVSFVLPVLSLSTAVLASPYAGEKSLTVQAGRTETISLGRLSQAELYGVLVYLPTVADLVEKDALKVAVTDAAGVGITKTLHLGDADLYSTLRPSVSGPGSIRIERSGPAEGKAHELRFIVRQIAGRGSTNVLLAASPTTDWQEAQRFELGATVYASNDERPYIPQLANAESVFAELISGAQWFTFEYLDADPKLVHFIVEVLDRDVPVDVALFIKTGGGGDTYLEPYNEGIERYNTEQSTKFHGLQKFIARVLKPGNYYVRVMGNHPFFRLRSEVYDPPPFTDPKTAIRVGLDYLLRKGDSWHANTPRRGSVVLRTSNRLGETAQCIACHPTHFTTRAELIAVENGWPVRERPALQFLTERLYNNPRPLYGAPEAVWARMISAPGNVLSRLGYLVTSFEKNISLEQRTDLLEPIGSFLERYWDGVDSPITESNGNLPRISGFEVALHSSIVFTELHRRTGDPKFQQLQQRVRQLIVEGTPLDMIDLCWKIVGLCELDATGFAPQIAKLVEEIWSRQKPNGTWSVAFERALEKDYRTGKERPADTPKDADGTPKQSEFQTYHALYALAKACVPADDPRMARAIQWCLSRQWPHGGWQGNPDFKNFDTVFRDTQYALMALTELHPGSGGHGWNAAFHPPSTPLEIDDIPLLLHRLDQHWTDPGPEIVQQAQRLLGHPQPLVRFAAASMLGRIADRASLDPLAVSLGDGSKMVQRAAAWALRQIATRRNIGHEQILAALNSTDDRVRWGALRVFNQHFKSITTNWRLGKALMERMQDDPSPINRVQAAQALWQWWFWDSNDGHKSAIEDVFLARLAAQEHPWTRRNLIEGLRNLLDENVRYLYNDWIPALKAEADRERVKAAHRATALRQAEKVSNALLTGNERQREGILRSFYTFHLRETTADLPAAISEFKLSTAGIRATKNERGEHTWIDGYKFAAGFDPGTAGTGVLGRIGNDTEPPTYYEDSGPILAAALRQLLENDAFVLPILRTLRSSRGLPLDGAFSGRLLELSRQPGQAPEVRHELLSELLPFRFTPASESIAVLADILRQDSEHPIRLAAAILRGPQGGHLAKDPLVLGSLQQRITQATNSDSDLAVLLEMLLRTADLQPLSDVRARVMELSRKGSEHLRQQALRTLLQGERFLLGARARREFEADLNSADAARLKEWLAAASSLNWKNYKSEAGVQLVLGTITTGLGHTDPQVQLAALDAVRQATPLGNNPAVRETLRLLSASGKTNVSESADALLSSLDGRTKGSDQHRGTPVDFRYFVQHVQPIFQREAVDGDSCARCHADHSILRLIPASEGQSLSEEQLRFNFLSAMKVIDLTNPEDSLLLVKPRSSFEGIGQPENYRKTHGGDVRWPEGKESREYDIILRWIRGAREE